jgi:small subunit ribosomal protein S18
MPPRERDRKRSPKDAGRKVKKKVCIFCKDKIAWVDYKDVGLLRKFMSDRGKIRARRVSGNCAQHQRDVAVAIKTARELALLPYSQRTTTESRGPRGDRRGRGPAPDLGAPTPDGAIETEGAEAPEVDAAVDETVSDGADVEVEEGDGAVLVGADATDDGGAE